MATKLERYDTSNCVHAFTQVPAACGNVGRRGYARLVGVKIQGVRGMAGPVYRIGKVCFPLWSLRVIEDLVYFERREGRV
jgi:hypothetical protein